MSPYDLSCHSYIWKPLRYSEGMGETTTISLRQNNKNRLDDVGEDALNDRNANYNSIVGFLIEDYTEY